MTMSARDVPTVLLRGDAGRGRGAGHVVRLAAVGAALRRRDVGSALLTTEAPRSLLGALDVRRMERVADEAVDPEAELPDELQRQDATMALEAFPRGETRAAVIDHYGLGAVWEEAVRAAGVTTIAAIDDLPGRRHAADLLIDPNLGPEDAGPVPAADGRILRGPAYAPLGPEYRDVTPVDRTGGQVRVLVTLGGGATGIAARVASLLRCERRLDGVHLEFVVPDPSERHAVVEELRARPRSEVRGHLPSLVESLARSDLVLSAGGTTAWQRLRLGVPGVMLALAPNQIRVCRALDEGGLGIWAERWTQDSALGRIVADAIDDRASADRIRVVGPLLCDGRGAERIALAMIPPAVPPSLRLATSADASALLAMANDPRTRRGSRNPRPVDPVAHLQWLTGRLTDLGGLFLAATSDDLVIGQVRFQRLDGSGGAESWELSYAIEAAARGNRWADPILVAGVRELRVRRPDATVVAVVGEANRRSHEAFRRLGFDHDPAGRRASLLGAEVGSGFSAYLLEAGAVTP